MRAFIASLLLVPLVLQAQIPGLEPEKDWELSGYVNYMMTGTLVDGGEDLLDNQVHNRLDFEYRFSSQLRFNASVRNRLFWGDSAQSELYREVIGFDPGYLDLTFNWGEGSDFFANTQFDRLYFDWHSDNYQGRVGRFRINWGMNTIWNPNDIFNSYSIYDVDYPERPGTDALYFTRKLGYASELNLAFSPSKDSELHSYSARYLFNVSNWDAQIIIGKSNLDFVIGAGLATDFVGSSLKAESTLFSPTKDEWQTADGNVQSLTTSVVSSVELGYNFSGARNWMSTVALLHITEPQDVQNAIVFLNLPLTARTLSFTEFTAYADLGFDITPLNRIVFSGSYYDDDSFYIGVSSTHSLSNDWQLVVVAQRFDGASDSLFGQTPNTLIFANLGWNF
ncbi:hypothetical protein [Vibrio breoganii]|uniref:hypothetical protein n=1 Tax=Vibrio breoganii TaxID=553239 RepID=UPI000C864CCE|nr:hypothetical protein [Vibrio breoganii]PML17961.1 hypothetical protein BCT84_04650 [Vibrio breoganii]